MVARFEEFVGLISNIQKQIVKMKAHEMKAYGLKGTHVMCLCYLAQNPNGLTASQLSHLIQVDRAEISRNLSQLQEQNFVMYCLASEPRKYKNRIILTPKGTKTAAQIEETIRDLVSKISTGLTPENRRELYASLRIISDNLEILKTEAGLPQSHHAVKGEPDETN